MSQVCKRTLLLVSLVCVATLLTRPAAADEGCTVKQLAGSWIFATSIGRQTLGAPFPADKDITAIGTMNIGRNGTLSGTFDVTVEDFAFIPGVVYSGEVIVNPDCTGTISFETSVGSVRTDSIAVLSRREIIAMSQDPLNLWTYQVRRIASNLTRNSRD